MKFSTRTVEYLVGILATLMIAAGLLIYAVQEPQRIVEAQATQQSWDLDVAMTLYAENCSVCHGAAGEGIGATPALANAALSQADAASLEKIIARGLFNTSMPAWSLEDGGPLSDNQISQLALLLQTGDWQLTQDRVVTLGLVPLIPFSAEADPQMLVAVKSLLEGDLLAQGVTVYAESCVACHGADGVGTSLAPPLNDPLLREKGADEILRIIQNGVPGTLMSAWNAALPVEEQDALLALITRWDEVPLGAIPAADQPLPVTAESLALGSDLYAANCARCHAIEGQGTPRAPALNVKSFLEGTPDPAVQQIITLGVPDTAMLAWGDRMSEVEIQAIVGFVRSWEATAPEVAVPQRGPWWRTSGASGGSANALPSGGVSQQQAAQATAQAGGQGAGQGKGGGTGQGTGQGSSGGQGAGSGAGAGQGDGAGQGAGSGTGSGAGAGGGPPWAQQQEQPASWWQVVDWRLFALVAGVLAAAFGLIITGWSKLNENLMEPAHSNN